MTKAKTKIKENPRHPRIVIEQRGDGIRVKIDNAHSRDHALFMMNQAMGNLILDSAEEKADENVQELPQSPGEEKEADVPNVPE